MSLQFAQIGSRPLNKLTFSIAASSSLFFANNSSLKCRHFIISSWRAIAIAKIQEKTGIDISRSALQRSPNNEHFQLFQLEKIASEVQEQRGEVAKFASLPNDYISYKETMQVISGIKGVGPSLEKSIGGALAIMLLEPSN